MAPLTLLLASGAAFAQTREADAERLFREGQKLMEERRFGEACPKFEQAYAKDNQLGTLINLAFCHKEQGAIWYAWLEFREAESKATEQGRNDRATFAKQRLAELEKTLPKVILDNPKKLPLTDVYVEDHKVWEADRGQVFAVEAGEKRKVVLHAKGKKTASMFISVTSSSKAQHFAIPDMEDGEDTAPPLPINVTVTAPAETPRTDTPPPAADTNPGGTQRTLGWISIGIGGVAAIVGVIAGASTLSSSCAHQGDCSSTQRSSADSSATLSTVAFIVAGVGVIGGAALVLTAPSSPPAGTKTTGVMRPPTARVVVTPRIGAGWAGLTGTF